MVYVLLESFRFESRLFRFKIDKCSVIEIILVTHRIDVVWHYFMASFFRFLSLCNNLYCCGLGFGWIKVRSFRQLRNLF